MENLFKIMPSPWLQLILSVSVFAIVTIVLVILYVRKSKRLSFDNKLLIFTIALTVSMWLLQYVADGQNKDYAYATMVERIALSFYHTLKSFGFDDNFLTGMQHVAPLFEATWHIYFYKVYAIILSFLAPLTGMAIVFEVLAHFFPKARLFILKFSFRKKFYFSELNERSLALAKSIIESSGKKRRETPIIIFADVYANKNQEIPTEQIAEAKLFGAICLREDITHIKKWGLGERKIFLIDDDEIKNIQSLTNLADNFNYKSLRKAEVYLFCQDPIYVDIEKQVRESLNNKRTLRNWATRKLYFFLQKLLDKTYKLPDGKTFKNDTYGEKKYKLLKKRLQSSYENAKFKNRATTIIPVRCYRNLITSMLEETPLYEPLVAERKNNPNFDINNPNANFEDADTALPLNVTILGFGDIGKEMFLNTYWMGQMLDCKLNITVVSNESEEEFWGKIDYINPEIRRTLQTNPNKPNEDPLLKIYPDDKESPYEVYGNVKYYSCNIESITFNALLAIDSKDTTILDTHYFLISLGSDKLNLSVANTLKNRIGEYHIKNQDKKTIINYVVYNADLSAALNTNRFVCSCVKTTEDSPSITPDIYMQAVGGVENLYSAEKIFMSKYKTAGEAAAGSYASKHYKTLRLISHKKRLKDEYEYWANLALRLHFKYKVFSTCCFSKSLFDAYDAVQEVDIYNNRYDVLGKFSFSQEKYDEIVAEGCNKYKTVYRKKKPTKPTVWNKIISFLEKGKKSKHVLSKDFAPFRRICTKLQSVVKTIDSLFTSTQEVVLFLLNKEPAKEARKTSIPNNNENLLQWLEHRRWCAFLRTMGFRQTNDYEEYLEVTQTHKQMDLKLHPCLVECDKFGMRGAFDEFGEAKFTLINRDEWDEIVEINEKSREVGDFDYLDQLTCKLANLKQNSSTTIPNFSPYDFKQYDYPNNDYLDEV